MEKIVRQLIIGLLLGVISPAQLYAMDDWLTVAIEDAGFNRDVGEKLDSAFDNGELKNLHSVVVARNHRLVLERYYEGYDKIWGDSIGNIKFTPDTLHDLQSITKSIVSLLYGIALAEGKVPKIDTPLSDVFPAYDDLMADSDRSRITVEHALTMTMGLDWNQSDYPHDDGRNSETAMWRAPDKYRYVLSQPTATDPGTSFQYSSGATVLLGHLISKGVSKQLFDYATEKLFDPMSITEVKWTKVDGDEEAAGGLRMKPRDLAKIGQLVLNQGLWNGNQIVPQSWLASSFLESASVDEKNKYGYQWWLGRLEKTNEGWVSGSGTSRWIAGIGSGNQGLIIIPEHQLVIVINAGNYGIKGTKLIPTIVLEYIFPGLKN